MQIRILEDRESAQNAADFVHGMREVMLSKANRGRMRILNIGTQVSVSYRSDALTPEDLPKLVEEISQTWLAVDATL